MERRTFLKTAAAGILAPSSLRAAVDRSARTARSHPDILLIMPDQMRGDCLSCLGHAALRTPNLDRLAKQGVLFRRAYTGVASCIPARFSLLTGLSPQASGVVGYATKPMKTSLPQALGPSGYTSILVGRNMHQGPECSCGYDMQILGSTYVAGDSYDLFLQRQAPQTGGIRQLVDDLGLDNNRWPAKPWPLPEDLHPNNWIVAKSREMLQYMSPDQPLFLTTSFYAPHPPLFPPEKLFDSYLDQPLPEPAHGDWVAWQGISERGNRKGTRVLLQGETLRQAQAGYFGLIEHIDTLLAGLIEDFTARSKNAGRPWLIVVTSDHGEMLGDHGYFRKCEPYEGSANIPLIVAGSEELGFHTGRQIHQPVGLEDIMPTVLALADTPCPDPVDGRDLSPTLQGREQAIRDFYHFEHAPCYSRNQAFHALTDGHFKYIWRPNDGREQLFDLDRDPREEHDLATLPSATTTLETWRTRLIARLTPRPEGFVQHNQLTPNQPYHPLNPGLPPS